MAVHEVFVYLCVPDAAAAVEFYGRAFGCEEKFRLAEPSGRVGHLELTLGDQVLMISEAFPELGVHPPTPGQPPPFAVHLHVDDTDAMVATAVAAGAKVKFPLADQFYGERSCRIIDPFGYEWILGHSIEEVSVEEMQRRYTAMCEKGEPS